ncbi:IS3 family transposase [Actinokineospora terrae]|uniref:IS3 family transposase n=1 Tax=Actinokineospora terrae TaxID=155974 RepID=UPI000B836177|nr:IS3 family transposase [Actinokineospora terrae]
MGQRRRRFSPEFKDEAVKLVESGVSVAEAARQLGLIEQTLRNWVEAHRKKNPKTVVPLSVDERARLRELERENHELRMKNEFLGKSRGLLRPRLSVTELYEFIDGEKGSYPMASMCEWMGVSRSGFHDWRARPASFTTERRQSLAAQITSIFTDSRRTYGYRRVHAALARRGVRCGPELVRVMMRDLGLAPTRRRRPLTTVAAPGIHTTPDLVRRDFTADRPGHKLVGDITYIPTGQGWLHLATVIDCATRKIIGWACADHLKTSLVRDAITMAATHTTLAPDAIFHSDRGTQYTSIEFREHLRAHRITPSLGRTGACWDNALAESFFATLKKELVHRTTYHTHAQARQEIATYIELFYNHTRLHSTLGYITPNEAENLYHATSSAA